MVIFVTDEGRYWNHENPLLEKYAECVVVVCLNGKKVTDKYSCVVVPKEPITGLGMTDYSVLSSKFQALKGMQKDLRYNYSYHDDIVFLADAEPQSLYPYLVLKDDEEFNKMHLWCMSPWKFEGKRRREAYDELLQDTDKLTSLCYIDSDIILDKMDIRATMPDLNRYGMEWLNSMLPSALYEIENNLRWDERYYFDTEKRRYISVDSGYEKILKAKALSKKKIEEFNPHRRFMTLGLLIEPDFPDERDSAKEAVERLHPRVDGKQICEEMKRLRKELADANGIAYAPVDCPSTGPCAGTCQQCDMELKYLQKQLQKIPQEDRVYPQFKVKKRTCDSPVKIMSDTDEDMPLMGLLYPTRREEQDEE